MNEYISRLCLPLIKKKKKEQISSSIMFPLFLFSHSQILFTVDLEVS